jgi:hypothetical protein
MTRSLDEEFQLDSLMKDEFPWFQNYYSCLDTVERASIIIKVCTEPRSRWVNGILHNSNVLFLSWDCNGTLDLFTRIGAFGNHRKMSKKRNIKTPEEVVEIIKQYINKCGVTLSF